MTYEKGKIVTGIVTGIENYGVFVSLDEYYNGLIHISEISNGFVRNVKDYVTIGEKIQVKVVEKADENRHIKLSIKDIDYRVDGVSKSKIVETDHAFDGLKSMLNTWICSKLDEINKKSE